LAPFPLPSTEISEGKRIMTGKVGIIGTGTIGGDHFQRLANEVVGSSVSAVFDVATDRAQELAASVGAVAHPSARDLIDDPNVDAVIIASPSELHSQQALDCVTAGKPVLCEKPLATEPAEALKVVEAEVAAGRKLVQVGFMRRYDKALLQVKAAMTDGSIGESLMAHAVHRNQAVPDWFQSDMSLYDSIVHEFDMFRWLFDQEIVSTTAVSVRRSPVGGEHLNDPQFILLELANGAVVDVESFVNCGYGYDVRCEIVGSAGTIAVQNPALTAVSGDGLRREVVPADWRIRFGDAYRAELQSWIAGLAEGEITGPGAWDGYAAISVAASAVASSHSGSRERVVLVDKPGLYW
jgi:myo-inositol 2-dehydrogenase/D-chiro-inositol 1-dehydrogenase